MHNSSILICGSEPPAGASSEAMRGAEYLAVALKNNISRLVHMILRKNTGREIAITIAIMDKETQAYIHPGSAVRPGGNAIAKTIFSFFPYSLALIVTQMSFFVAPARNAIKFQRK